MNRRAKSQKQHVFLSRENSAKEKKNTGKEKQEIYIILIKGENLGSTKTTINPSQPVSITMPPPHKHCCFFSSACTRHTVVEVENIIITALSNQHAIPMKYHPPESQHRIQNNTQHENPIYATRAALNNHALSKSPH